MTTLVRSSRREVGPVLHRMNGTRLGSKLGRRSRRGPGEGGGRWETRLTRRGGLHAMEMRTVSERCCCVALEPRPERQKSQASAAYIQSSLLSSFHSPLPIDDLCCLAWRPVALSRPLDSAPLAEQMFASTMSMATSQRGITMPSRPLYSHLDGRPLASRALVVDAIILYVETLAQMEEASLLTRLRHLPPPPLLPSPSSYDASAITSTSRRRRLLRLDHQRRPTAATPRALVHLRYRRHCSSTALYTTS